MRPPKHTRISALAQTIVLTLALALAVPASSAQSSRYVMLSSGEPVRDKCAYLFTLFEQDPAARAAIASDPRLSALLQRSNAQLHSAMTSCPSADAPVDCAVERLSFSDADIQHAGSVLAELAAPGGPLSPLVRNHLRPSGVFQKHAELDDAAMLQAAFDETARGVNRLYRVYALGDKPHYPAIDSMSYKPGDKSLSALVKSVVETAVDEHERYDLFFQPWARVGFDMLVINQRDEAGRFEPMTTRANAKACDRVRELDFSAYPYTAIVLPGAGNLKDEVGLSAEGALRVRITARRYHDKLAPFILVSGGNVHPNKTPYNEAVEMKRALMNDHDVPESAIFIDPHARHTTTNLRNAVRILFRAGVPVSPNDHPILITTSRDQSVYIQSDDFAARNQRELGYQPMVGYTRTTPHDLEARANLMSLHADITEPLDP